MRELVSSGSGNAKGGSNISLPPYLQLAPRRWGQRGQSVADLTARGRGLDCFQPQPWQLVSTRSSRAPCAFPNLRCDPRCWLFSCLGLWSHPHISPKEHQKERCGHYSAAALLHYFSWCASRYSVAGRIFCYVLHDNVRTNVCQWPFAENFHLLIPLLNQIDSISNLYIFTISLLNISAIYLYFIALDFPT